jgi:hypothetical protein
MHATLISLGIACVLGIVCVIAADMRGALKAFGVELPALNSSPRQLILGLIGVLLIFTPLTLWMVGRPAQSPVYTTTPSPHEGSIQHLENYDLVERPPVNEPVTLLSDGTLSIIYTDLGENVALSVQAPENTFPAISVDVNGNSVLDRDFDTYYASSVNGQPCNGYMLTPSTNSECGAIRTASSLQFAVVGPSRRYVWTLPKGEIARHSGRFVQFAIWFLNGGPPFYFPAPPFAHPQRISW